MGSKGGDILLDASIGSKLKACGDEKEDLELKNQELTVDLY